MVAAILVVDILLTQFNNFTGKSISPNFILQPEFAILLIFVVFLLGILAGSYPAFFLSSFQPLTVLKGTLKSGAKTASARKFLVIMQFTISISLIISTLVVFSQLNFIRNADLGFKKDQIITIKNAGQLFQNYEVFKEELLKHKDIEFVTGAEDVLGVNHNTRAYKIEGLDQNQAYYIPTFLVDWDFVETFGIKVVEGRAFSKDFMSDTIHGIMINETMVKDLGWTNQDAIGKKITSQDGDERVIGIFKDFNAMSLHKPVNKFILDMFRRPSAFAVVISIRLKNNNYQEVLKFLEETWKKFVPSRPFEYQFFDTQLNTQYKDDERFGNFSLILTVLAIIIASIGLIGLTSFLAEQRTKEIGIRRALGASVISIVNLMFREFVILLITSIVISWPVTYFATTKWLESYSKHISTNWGLYILSGLVTVTISLLITGYQAYKISQLNPSVTLKYE
jgi:putative ABC transport system permease protein